MQLVLLGAVAHAQVPNYHFTRRTENTIAIVEPHVLHIFEYSLPGQTVLLEFSQDECQASVTEEYIIPDVPANPGNMALTMLFNAACDLGLSTTDTVPLAHRAPREIIEEFLVGPDGLRMLVKFDK